MYARAANQYRQVDLNSASKPEILDRLFLRFVRDCKDAEAAVGRGDIKARVASINHATQIVTELTAALDHDRAPELCANLLSLYDYVQDRLLRANMNSDAQCLQQAANVMESLRISFLEARNVRS